MMSKATFTMHMNNESMNATSYVNGIANIVVFLLANTDKQVIDNLLVQVGEEEKMFIQSAMVGIEQRLQEK